MALLALFRGLFGLCVVQYRRLVILVGLALTSLPHVGLLVEEHSVPQRLLLIAISS